MKRLIMRTIRPFWKLTSVIRRPVARRLDARLNHMIAVALRTQLLPTIQGSLDASARTLDRLESSLGVANRSAELMAADMDLMLESVVREVARLQAQIDTIQDLVEQTALPTRAGLSIVEDDDDGRGGDRVSWPAELERSKVG